MEVDELKSTSSIHIRNIANDLSSDEVNHKQLFLVFFILTPFNRMNPLVMMKRMKMMTNF